MLFFVGFAAFKKRRQILDKANPNLSIEYADGATLATLMDEKILQAEQVQSLEQAFLPLVEQNDSIRLVIDFSKVQFLTSSLLGLLIRLNKKVCQNQGRLRLCSIDPKILEIFKITRLDKVLEICSDRQQALIDF